MICDGDEKTTEFDIEKIATWTDVHSSLQPGKLTYMSPKKVPKTRKYPFGKLT